MLPFPYGYFPKNPRRIHICHVQVLLDLLCLRWQSSKHYSMGLLQNLLALWSSLAVLRVRMSLKGAVWCLQKPERPIKPCASVVVAGEVP